ncbi:MAG: putative transrane anti-sigma factor [Microbacteriaceae bacterium]|nr:putative transrane anti-sigma factor [Microbacteriaceae bacterium]
MSANDPYAEWDAAYVLGSLSATERREFEQHLAECDSCALSVAELAGLPGLLAKVPAEDALALSEAPGIPMPPTLLPRLVRSARRRQRRARAYVAGGIVAAAAVAAALVLVLPTVLPAAEQSQTQQASRSLQLSQVVTSPITASIHLVPEGWGTRIEMKCGYGPVPTTGPAPTYDPATARSYAMYVTDKSGKSTEVATWWASPGTTAWPSGTVSLPVDRIASVDVRAVPDGTVLLRGAL